MGPMEGESVMILSPQDMETHAKATHISSYGQFYQKDPERWLRYLRALRPVPSLIPNHPYLNSGAVGVHIRRGDHTKAKKFSPTASFISAMNGESPDTVFIVATDSNTDKKIITDKYNQRVWFPATSLSRMTQKGMNDAVTDFIALSRCKKILGSYNSSFSELAAMYGDVPLKVVIEKGE
jgi:hypothetical protein